MSESEQDAKPDSKAEAARDDKKHGSIDGEKRSEIGSGPTPPEAWIIHEVIRQDGEREIERSLNSLAWSGFGAGLSMGFSFLSVAMLRAGLPDATWTHLVSGFGYPIGFLIVVLGRQQLFTESTLTAVLPFLTRRDAATFAAMVRLWVVVLLANLIGTFVFATLISFPGLFEPSVTKALSDVSMLSLHDEFVPMMLKAVLSGWLIGLMVWLLPGAGPARLLLIVILTYIVALGQFSHMIAGSVEAAYAVVSGGASVGDYFMRFALPTLIGNMFGGVSLVAILNHAPVHQEIKDNKAARR